MTALISRRCIIDLYYPPERGLVLGLSLPIIMYCISLQCFKGVIQNYHKGEGCVCVKVHILIILSLVFHLLQSKRFNIQLHFLINMFMFDVFLYGGELRIIY